MDPALVLLLFWFLIILIGCFAVGVVLTIFEERRGTGTGRRKNRR
jgi:hypothetical protein